MVITLREIKSAGVYIVEIPAVHISRAFKTLGMAQAYIKLMKEGR